ncbi:MAG: hypothetical protein FJZ63_02785 [Chlamydiae bacterium]|nr:hypothetical protein [Chlamydiota bacterium]
MAPITHLLRSPICSFLEATLNYNTIKAKAPELASLAKNDLRQILDLASKNAFLHEAAKKQDFDFIQILIEQGIDIKAVDDAGHSFLSYVTQPEKFLEYHQQGAPFIHPHCTFLEYCITQCNSTWLVDRSRWERVVFQLLPAIDLKDFASLPRELLLVLCRWLQDDKKANDCQSLLERLFKEREEDFYKMVTTLLDTYDPAQPLDIRIFFKTQFSSVMSENFLRKIFFHPGVLAKYLANRELFHSFSGLWKFKVCEDIRLDIYYHAILNTTSLAAVAELFSPIFCLRMEIPKLAATHKQTLLHHIETLQVEEGTTLWFALQNFTTSPPTIELMLQLGCRLDWEDERGRHFLFSTLVPHTSGFTLSEEALNWFKTDSTGRNALEYHCQHVDRYKEREILVELGLQLQDNHPQKALAQTLFPESPLLQAALATLLAIFPTRGRLEKLCDNMNPIQTKAFQEAILRSQPTTALLDENILKLRQLSLDTTAPSSTPFQDFPLLIPQSRKASSLLCKMQQHCPMPSIKDLFYGFTHDDLLLFYQHVFQHSASLQGFINTYMKTEAIYLVGGGGVEATYADFIYASLNNLGYLQELQHKALSQGVATLQTSFHRAVAPIPRETLEIVPQATLSLVGRTIVCQTSPEEADAYKFLKPSEKYNYFSEEHSVSEAFGNLSQTFQSRFIKPVAIYSLKKLPQAFEVFKDRLPFTGEYSYLFHYKAHPSTFIYLQNIEDDADFHKARQTILHDGAKMLAFDIYPHSNLFHNDSTQRGYILLVDLALRISDVLLPTFSPGGGAGRLDQAFSKLAFPNQRASGWTDLRDADVGCHSPPPYAQIADLKDVRRSRLLYRNCFYRLHGLSMMLLEDMLFLAQRLQKQEKLRWNNPQHMEAFSLQLLEGFATLSASYANKPLEDYKTFAAHCGIDWIRAARQIAFWLDTSENGYPDYIAQDKLPEGLYEASAQIFIDHTTMKNFTKEQGFSTEGHQDIGPFNGPAALTEFEKIAHLLFVALMLAEPLQNAARESLHTSARFNYY